MSEPPKVLGPLPGKKLDSICGPAREAEPVGLLPAGGPVILRPYPRSKTYGGAHEADAVVYLRHSARGSPRPPPLRPP